jgi:hemoglobin/transferrin/lactoferrin receptor protein
MTANLGFIYKPSETWQFNTVLSSGFRSPNIDDVGKVREKSGFVTVPNINLKPEYAYNVELGVLKHFNNNKLFIGFTTYYTLLDNYIIRENFSLNGSSTINYDGEVGTIVANVNKNTAYIFGGTFDIKGELSKNFRTRASLTFTKGETYDTKEKLSSIPPLFGLIEITHQKGRFEWSLEMKFNGRKKPESYNISEGIDRIEQTPFVESTGEYYGSPSFTSINFNAKCRITKNIDVLLGIDNLFDSHYKEFASGISSPGRNFSISLLTNF